MRWLPLAALGGCPFLFGPPDLSHVDGPDGDADPHTGSSAGTHSAPLPSDGPEVLSFTVSPRLGGVALSFVVTDPQGDFAGGTVTASDGTDAFVFAIPADVPDFNANGVNSVVVARDPSWVGCDTDTAEAWTLTVTDFAGHPSAPASAAFSLVSAGVFPEIGDNRATDHHTFDTPPPWLACVEFEADPTQPPPDLAELASDHENIEYALTAGVWTLGVSWTDPINLDTVLFDPDLSYPQPCAEFSYGVPAPGSVECTFTAVDGDYLYDPMLFNARITGEPRFRVVVLLSPQ